MNFLSVEKISKTYGEDPVIREASFGLDQGDKVAIVGVNGCGKSTLLGIIAGKEVADSGEVRMNKNTKYAFLDQNPEFTDDQSVFEAILTGEGPFMEVVRSYHRLLVSDPGKMDEIISRMDSLNAWDFESSINQILGKLGIENPQDNVNQLSGGMKKRVALAKALLEEPDFLILDEPTNHLDLEAIEWLENYLANNKKTLLVVSHDRYFLDRVCNTIIEIDVGKIFKHKGNYVSYLQNKEERKLQQQLVADKARNLLSKELEWLRRQPKARGTKSKSRIERVFDLKDTASSTPSTANLNLAAGTRKQGKKIMEIRNLSKSFPGKNLIDNFSYTFQRGEKIGIVGKNGSGKSTFLNVLTGDKDMVPDNGEIDYGINTVFGYYKQEEFPFSEDVKVIDAVAEVADFIVTPDGTISASQLLNRFMFPPKRQYDFISKLSGGEKKRLQLLRVLMGDPNFLILDEPTNDLDIVTLNILEEYLMDFQGCLILVSHDRYFMDKLVDHLFIFSGTGKIQDFNGNYTDFRASFKHEIQQPTGSTKSEKFSKPRLKEERKLSYKEKQEFESLDQLLKELEERKDHLSNLLSSGETDHEKLTEWGKQLEEIKLEIDSKELRWLELAEMQG